MLIVPCSISTLTCKLAFFPSKITFCSFINAISFSILSIVLELLIISLFLSCIILSFSFISLFNSITVLLRFSIFESSSPFTVLNPVTIALEFFSCSSRSLFFNSNSLTLLANSILANSIFLSEASLIFSTSLFLDISSS